MQYPVFVIDPPYPKKKGGLRRERPHQTRAFDYPTLSFEEIFKILDEQVFARSTPDHCLFVWCIDQFLIDVESEFYQRGYKRHARLIWDKTNGVAPAFTVRYSHEYLLWLYKDKLLPINKAARGKFTSLFREKSREHSRKPDISYQMIDSLYPDVPKLDVFSREKREGWDQFGNETEYFKK